MGRPVPGNKAAAQAAAPRAGAQEGAVHVLSLLAARIALQQAGMREASPATFGRARLVCAAFRQLSSPPAFLLDRPDRCVLARDVRCQGGKGALQNDGVYHTACTPRRRSPPPGDEPADARAREGAC